jgi:hypothetical protein
MNFQRTWISFFVNIATIYFEATTLRGANMQDRRYLRDQLTQRDGGPLGIDSVEEIVIETSNYETTVSF